MPQTRGSNAESVSASPKKAKHVGFASKHNDGETEAEPDDHSDTDSPSSEEETSENVKSAAKTKTKTAEAMTEQELRELFAVVDRATTGGKLRKVYRTSCDECSSRELDCAYEASKQSCGFCNRKHRGCKRGGVPVSHLAKKLAKLTSDGKADSGSPSKSTSSSSPENAVSPFQRERSQRQIKPTGDPSIARTTGAKPAAKLPAQGSTGSGQPSTSGQTWLQAMVEDDGATSASASRPKSERASGVIPALPAENGAKSNSSANVTTSTSNSASTVVASSSKQPTSSSASAPAKKLPEAPTSEKRKLRPVLKSLTGPSSSFTSQSDDDTEAPAAKRRKQETRGAASLSAANKKATAAASASKNTPAAKARQTDKDKTQPEATKRPPKRTQPQSRAASSTSPPPPPSPPPRNQARRAPPKVQPNKDSSTKLNAMFESYKNLDRLVDSLNDLMSVGDMPGEQTDEVKTMRRDRKSVV